ncbi:MAG: methyltransferase domain-containing protein [Ignavibacteriales bacterium]|nr:methyltransferase domain-containing protein [Ignavibacteriales bacterium]
MPDNNGKQAHLRSIEEFYDLLAPNYDTMTSFEQRFIQERPFFQALIDRFHFRSALDAGCGSGFHSLLLSQLGVDVLGVDVSAEMLRLAEGHARELSASIRTLQGSFENLGDLIKERFESVFAMGNSLAHLLSAATVEKALRNFATVLDPHGVLVVQILNYERVVTRREHIQNEKQVGTKTFVRSYDYDAAGILFNIVTREQKNAISEEKIQTVRLRPVFRAELVTLLERVGFTGIDIFGGISLVPFDALNSKDLIVLAKKRG